MVNITRDEILNKGYADVKVNVQGLRQNHRLAIEVDKTPRGTITYLVSKLYIPTGELIRLAESLQFPIKHNTTVVFPKGKMPKDFLESTTISIQPDLVEAELED